MNPMERGAVKKKPVAQHVAEHIGWRVFISLVYITGLTLLIPSVFLFVFPSELNIVSPATSAVVVWCAVAFILLSIVVTVILRKSVGAALKALGRVTFIPGLIGLVFSLIGRDVVLLYLAGTVPNFPVVRETLTLLIEQAVPHVRYLTVGYFVLGLVLWLVGDKMQRDSHGLL